MTTRIDLALLRGHLTVESDVIRRMELEWIVYADKETVPQLIRALSDSHELVRSFAAQRLGEIGPDARDAVPALIRLLADPESRVRCSAAQALGEIGPDARDATMALDRLLKQDARMVVRIVAKRSIGKLAGNS